MAFPGWLQLGGAEIVNNQRAAAYARSLAPKIAPKCDDCDDLAQVLGDVEYASPMVDEAPWYDPGNPDTARFAGFYALSVSGLEDSTRTAPIVESLHDGGAVLRARRGTKEIRVSGLLMAADECSLDLGMNWLKNSLEGSTCRDAASGCEGDELCFLSCCPDVADGTVDPNADPVVHVIPLNIGWSTSNGTWVNGLWTPSSLPATATGAELDPPCDDVVYSWVITAAEGHVVQLTVLGEDGSELASTGPILLRRVNWAQNPSFRTNANFWTPGADVTLTAETTNARGLLETTAGVAAGAVLASTDSPQMAAAGEQWSARMQVQLDPEGVVWDNLVPNPAVRTLNGWESSSGTLVRDTDLFYTDSGSARVGPTMDGGTALGSMGYGNDGQTQYEINVDGATDYGVAAYVNPSLAADILLSVSWFNAAGSLVGFNIGATTNVPADTWTRVERTYTSPNTAARMVVAVGATSTGGEVSAGDRLNVDALMVSPQLPLAAYFDGSYPDAMWTGLQHGSPSVWSPSSEELCVQAQLTVGGTVIQGSSATVTPTAPVEVTVSGVFDPVGGAVELALVGCGVTDVGTRIYVSSVLIERAATPGTYFDGDTIGVPDYTATWAGSGNNAPSRLDRNNPIQVTAPSGSGPIEPAITAVAGSQFQVQSLTATYRDAADPELCFNDALRTLRKVTTISGPVITERFDLCDAAMARVEFIMVAAIPWVYQRLEPAFEVVGDAFLVIDEPCPEDDSSLLPLNDPACPLPPNPPRPPVIAECVVDVHTYRRRLVTIPGDLLSPWEQAVPVITARVLTATAVRQARIRFYPNPLERTSMLDIDPCGFCGDFVISYIPGNSEITLDGMTERAIVTQPGDIRKDATHLLYGTDGGPMTWPLLTCGVPYLMVVDTAPANTDVLTTELQLVVRS